MTTDPQTTERSFGSRALVIVLLATLMLGVAPQWGGELRAAATEFNSVPRTPAPSLEGGGEWINTAGPLRLQQLRGKFVILDFWTYCCINCLQTLPELKRLEQAFPRHLVVIGVHSPKFIGERDTENIRDAVVRHDVGHPVVNDANLAIARKYGVQGWPSLRVIDPQGNLIATHYGEATFEMMSRYLKRLIPRYRRDRVLDETPLRFELERDAMEPTPLRFPGKILADEESDRLFISDSGYNRIVVTTRDGTLLDVIGSGQFGRQDGAYDRASFAHPQGLALHDGTLYVADTENHLLRRVDLGSKRVSTVAGTGQQARQIPVRAGTRATATKLASPWDLWVHKNEMYIAMAGTHQLWSMTLGSRSRLRPFAGNGAEDIVDGRLLPRTAFQKGFASFAQPSGLTSNGQSLFVADSEGSSIRAVPFQANGNVATVLGTSRLADARLFTFGDRDGPLQGALLQHPLAVAFWQNRLYVADTYNNKVKEIDLKRGFIRTVAGDRQPGDSDQPPRFDEPAGLSVTQDGSLFVADTNNHVIRVIDLNSDYRVRTLKTEGLQPAKPPEVASPASVPGTEKHSFGTVEVKPTGGRLRVHVQLELPGGQSLNDQAPMSYVVDAAGENSFVAPSVVGKRIRLQENSQQFDIDLPLSKSGGTTQLKVAVVFYYCRKGAEAICKMGSAEWTGQVKLTPSASSSSIDLRHAVR